MSIKARLSKLHQERRGKGGRCPGCGFAPDGIRTIVISRQSPGGPVRPLFEVVADDMPQPGRPRCSICGGYMPPIATVDERNESEVESA
jgi:hypothetical protein